MTKEEAQAKLKGILGAEFVYENDHFSTIATVVAADIEKGVTVKGVIPNHCARLYGEKEGVESVLYCGIIYNKNTAVAFVEELEDTVFKAVETGFFIVNRDAVNERTSFRNDTENLCAFS